VQPESHSDRSGALLEYFAAGERRRRSRRPVVVVNQKLFLVAIKFYAWLQVRPVGSRNVIEMNSITWLGWRNPQNCAHGSAEIASLGGEAVRTQVFSLALPKDRRCEMYSCRDLWAGLKSQSLAARAPRHRMKPLGRLRDSPDR